MKKFIISLLTLSFLLTPIISLAGVNELQYTNYKDTGLVAYYRMEGNSNDNSGNGNNGTDTSVTYGTDYGRFGQGANFSDSTNSKITLTTRIELTTVSLWMNASNVTNKSILFDVTNNQSIQTDVSNNLLIYDGSTNHTSSINIPSGSWLNIVLTYVTDGYKVYISGKYLGKITTGKVYVGSISRGSGGAYGVVGYIDDVSFFNRVPSDWEIWNIAQGHSAGEYIPNANTKLYLPLNGNSADVSNNAKNMTETGTLSYVSAKLGQGVSATFNKTNYFYNTSLYTPGTDNITMSVWFKQNGASGTNYTPTIMSLGYNRTDVTNQRLYLVASKSTGYAAFYSFDGSYTYVDSTKNISDNVWHNVIGVRSGTTMNIYVDGALVGTNTGTARNIGAADFRVGNVGDATYDILGDATMDEIIIESTAWSASQVRKYYTQSLGRHTNIME